MRKQAASCCLVLFFLTLSGCQPGPGAMSVYWRDWGDQHLDKWVASSVAMQSEITKFCGDGITPDGVRSAWRQTFLDWSSTTGFPYKGIDDMALQFELYFWPDKRNLVAARMQRMIDSAENFSESTLDYLVAAEKGMAAMEWLLFTSELTPEQACRFLPIIAKDYGDKVVRIKNHHQANPVVMDEWQEEGSSESRSISLNLLFQQINTLRSRLQSSTNDQGEWLEQQALGWRSDTTLESLSTSMDNLLAHLTYLSNRPELEKESQDQLQNLLADGHDILAYLTNASSTLEFDAELVNKFFTWFDELDQLINNGVAKNFNILIGFNNFDGD